MKVKKLFAVAMATMMVMSMSITALADDAVPNPNSSEGAGASEGHVEQKLTNVVIPTVATDGENTVSPFRYTMDPERLISTTAAAKYEDVIYPESADDTGVYFNNGPDTTQTTKTKFSGKSNTVTVTNKSSHDISLTVTAEAVASAGGKDIPLVAQEALGDADVASLYLGLIVGDGSVAENKAAITSEAAATKTVTLTGKSANFQIAVDANKNYVYREKTLEEWKAIQGNGSKTQADYDADWSNTTFGLEGETTTGKAIATDTTAPKVKVTWKWTDPTAGPSITTKTATAVVGTDTEIVFTGNASDVSDIKFNTTSVKGKTTITDGKITVLSSWTDGWASGTTRTLTVEFTGGTTDTFVLTKE